MISRIMHLANEAGYLYVLSKELMALNKQLKKLTSKAEKHLRHYSDAKTEEERLHRHTRHTRTTIEISHLLKKHHLLLQKLKHHHLAFDHTLVREHKI